MRRLLGSALLIALVTQIASAQECQSLALAIGRETQRFGDQQQVPIAMRAQLCSAEYESSSSEQRAQIEASYSLFSGGASGSATQIRTLQSSKCEGKYGYFWSSQITSSELNTVSQIGAEVIKACLNRPSFHLTDISLQENGVSALFKFGGTGSTTISGILASPNEIVSDCRVLALGKTYSKLDDVVGLDLPSGSELALACTRVGKKLAGNNIGQTQYQGGVLTVATTSDTSRLPLIEYVDPPIAVQAQDLLNRRIEDMDGRFADLRDAPIFGYTAQDLKVDNGTLAVPLELRQSYTSHTHDLGVESALSRMVRPDGWPYWPRLWSLWDMFRLKGRDFYLAITELQRIRDLVAEMEMKSANDRNSVVVFDRDSLQHKVVRECLVRLVDHLNGLNADHALMAAIELAHQLKGSIGLSALNQGLGDIDRSLQRGMLLTAAFVLSPDEKDLFEPKSPHFGEEVARKFGCIEYDIGEAAKCLAFGRSTAAVFHSARCLEAGLLAISRCLGLPEPTKGTDKNWGAQLRNIKSEIDRRWDAKLLKTGDSAFFEEIHASLAGMKGPWRDGAMHLDRTYTEETARHIFDVVGGLMRRLASQCDENGEPKV